ncbi:MAG: hypothetical protein JWQ57_3391 [Mucilaginibacter sp.]|jgi:mRNA-degrading endonuclease RelE of RelBE toxin-antitoxin system|nr:hypothetical protein [Mucilaginibacter sp.]
MKTYRVTISATALSDIHDITNWYNKRLPKLGARFQKIVKQQIGTLRINAESYNTRYNQVQCMPVRKFPYLIHFMIDDTNQIVEVFAIIHTSRSPEIWEERNQLH